MRPEPIKFLTGTLSPRAYPSGVGLPGTGEKFTTDGVVEIWPGNTFVCHVERPSPAYAALMELQEAVKQSEFAAFFTFLPPPSFHMTVFQGMSPGNQGTPEWPRDVPVTASRDDVTETIAARTRGLELPEVRIRAKDLFCARSLTVTGIDEAAERTLRQARSDLRDATGISPRDFDSYVFHITLSYLIHWLSVSAATELAAFSDELFGEFEEALQDISLEPCAFCNFDSMHHFEPVL